MTTPDFPDFTEARSIADEIAIIGAPLLRLTKSLGFGVGTNLPQGVSTLLLNNVPINQPGYEAKLSLFYGGQAVPAPFAQLVMSWSDSASGLVVDGKVYNMAVGFNGANVLDYYMSGPCRGDLLTVTLVNLDGTFAGTANWAFDQISHVYTQDRLIQPFYAATPPNGFTNPGGFPATGLLATQTAAVVQGNPSQRLLAAFAGKVWLNVDNAGGANACEVFFKDPSTIYGGPLNAVMYYNKIAAGGRAYERVMMPNGPVLLQTANDGATNITPLIAVTLEESSL